MLDNFLDTLTLMISEYELKEEQQSIENDSKIPPEKEDIFLY